MLTATVGPAGRLFAFEKNENEKTSQPQPDKNTVTRECSHIVPNAERGRSQQLTQVKYEVRMNHSQEKKEKERKKKRKKEGRERRRKAEGERVSVLCVYALHVCMCNVAR